jgi:hypothetical protein
MEDIEDIQRLNMNNDNNNDNNNIQVIQLDFTTYNNKRNNILPTFQQQWSEHKNKVEARQISDGVALFTSCSCGVRVAHVQMMQDDMMEMIEKDLDAMSHFQQTITILERNNSFMISNPVPNKCKTNCLAALITGRCPCMNYNNNDQRKWYLVSGPRTNPLQVDVFLVWMTLYLQ